MMVRFGKKGTAISKFFAARLGKNLDDYHGRNMISHPVTNSTGGTQQRDVALGGV